MKKQGLKSCHAGGGKAGKDREGEHANNDLPRRPLSSVSVSDAQSRANRICRVKLNKSKFTATG